MIVSGRPLNCSLSSLSSPSPLFSAPLFTTFRNPRLRHYATEARLNLSHHHHGWPPHPSPTPYQIFNCKPGAPYSKTRFYELVKLYHPDHSRQRRAEGLDISEPIRLERFRLVVAANAILSDPVKRGNYDRYGVGWQSTPACGYGGVGGRARQRAWWTDREGNGGAFARAHYGKGGPDDPARNATWEDWERWYQRRAYAGSGTAASSSSSSSATTTGEATRHRHNHQAPVYTSNGTFVAIVIAFASVGALMNFGRASATGRGLLERRNGRHAEISREMARRRREVGVLGGRDERVKAFLKNRDPEGHASGRVVPLAEHPGDASAVSKG